jgi:site-specific recombinase
MVSASQTGRDQRDRLALHRMLKPIADKSRNIAAYMHRHLSGVTQ